MFVSLYVAIELIASAFMSNDSSLFGCRLELIKSLSYIKQGLRSLIEYPVLE